MDGWMRWSLEGLVIALIIVGLWCFRTPRRARWGNLSAAAAIGLAMMTAISWGRLTGAPLVFGVFVVAAAVAWVVAIRLNMIELPALVAMQNGAGGGASFLVAYVGLATATLGSLPGVGIVVGLLGIGLGAATLSGSVIAAGRLAGRMKQTPTILRHHNTALVALVVLASILAVFAGRAVGLTSAVALLLALTLSAVALGVLFAIRIGGADMPVLISMLNATSGLAAAMCGVVVQNRLLIACGATVAASGSILTHVMCRAMNRSLVNVFGLSRGPGIASDPSPGAAAPSEPTAPSTLDPTARALQALTDAGSIIIVPGYGMALAEAADDVVRLAETLTRMGKHVRFAIHPVAGRMPGHMHVLLAEADVDYSYLFELDAINDDFRDTDVALIVGACDVANPAAIHQEGTPISGMPVLAVHDAATAIVCNLDTKPGYSGVPNPLYDRPETILLLGDAKASVNSLLAELAGSAADGGPGGAAAT